MAVLGLSGCGFLHAPLGDSAGPGKGVSGTFISRLSGGYNIFQGTGSFTGLKVLRFNQGKLGYACLNWASNVSNGGNSETGSFKLDGGTKLAARSRATGTFTGTKSQTGTSATVTGTVTTSVLVGKNPKQPSSDCLQLAGQL